MEQDTSGAFLYVLAAGVAAGVALALTFALGAAFIAVCAGTSLALIAFGSLARYTNMFLAAIFFAALMLGVLRTDAYLSAQQKSSLRPYETYGKDTAMVEGVVSNDPEHRAASLHINVAVQKINNQLAAGELLAVIDRTAALQYGDTVVLQGSIAEPQPFETSAGHVFDYAGYLQVQGISAMMPHATVAGQTAGGFSIQKFLFNVKHLFERSVENIFPEPDGSLLEGILLGERRGIPQNITDAFAASSLVHVLVLSGHNMTIVSEGVFRALAFLPRTASYGVGAVVMIAFALMTGAGATTIRALLMALVALLARYLHRSALALRSLAVAAAAMIVWNPPALLHDSSFMLSMLATFGLITLSPLVEQRLWRVPRYKRFDARSIIATTVAVEIFVTPALLYFNGTVSFFALPANVIALPAVPLAMLAGFIAGLAGLVHPSLALLPALVCHLCLQWLLLVATTIQSLPYSTATVAQFPAWVMCAVYVPLTLFAIFAYRRSASVLQTS